MTRKPDVFEFDSYKVQADKKTIDFRGLINFPYSDMSNIQPIQPRRLDEAKKNRFLVGIGGGKDSIVAIELLKKENKPLF